MANPKSAPLIHVLGLGSIGCFVAHCLAEIPNRPNITLLLHRASLVDGFVQNGNRIALNTTDGKVIAQGGYSLDVLQPNGEWHNTDTNNGCARYDQSDRVNPPSASIIENLIVCVKATKTVAAIRPLVSRLAPSSTILFIQNGAGMIEDVNEHLFRDIKTRPNYITGVIYHGVTLNGPFNIYHNGPASTSLGPVPRGSISFPDHDTGAFPNSSYLLKALPLTARLEARSYSYSEILKIQLEKLTVNAFGNPLCALADSPNKYLFTLPGTRRALIAEISRVILAMPELKGQPGLAERFSAGPLESMLERAIHRVSEVTSSMVWDLRAGRETEIRYINGYWQRRGRDVGVPTPINDQLIEEILSRTKRVNMA